MSLVTAYQCHQESDACNILKFENNLISICNSLFLFNVADFQRLFCEEFLSQ